MSLCGEKDYGEGGDGEKDYRKDGDGENDYGKDGSGEECDGEKDDMEIDTVVDTGKGNIVGEHEDEKAAANGYRRVRTSELGHRRMTVAQTAWRSSAIHYLNLKMATRLVRRCHRDSRNGVS